MVEEGMSKLLKLSLCFSLFGTLTLLYIANMAPSLTEISEIDSSFLYQQIKIHGQITRTTEIDSNFYIHLIEDKAGKIQATSSKKIPKTNKTLEIFGQVLEYQEDMQIKINKVIEIE